MNLIGIKSVWRSGKPDEWGHLAVAVEIDAEVDVVGIKIDRSRESRRVTKGCLKNPSVTVTLLDSRHTASLSAPDVHAVTGLPVV